MKEKGKVKTIHKDTITNALCLMSVLDFRPFQTCEEFGFMNYSQKLVDIAAKIGIFDIKDILPVATTVSRNLNDIYKAALSNIRRNIVDSCNLSPFGIASSTEQWSCKWTNVCNTGLAVHYISSKWTLENHLLALTSISDDKLEMMVVLRTIDPELWSVFNSIANSIGSE
jgi:hypothetical protein